MNSTSARSRRGANEVTDLSAVLVRRLICTACVEIRIVNYNFDNGRQARGWKGRRCHLLPYRKCIKLLSVGGAILPLLSSQGRSATLRWASSSNRIALENRNSHTSQSREIS